MAGYTSELSKSNNAIEAEAGGRFPLTHAKRIVSEATGVSQAVAAGVLMALFDGEYHHSSKFYNIVKYYPTKAAIAAIVESRRFEKDILAFANFCADWSLLTNDGEINWVAAEGDMYKGIELQDLGAELAAVPNA